MPFLALVALAARPLLSAATSAAVAMENQGTNHFTTQRKDAKSGGFRQKAGEYEQRQLNDGDNAVCFADQCQDDPLYKSSLGLTCADFHGLIKSEETCLYHWKETNGRIEVNEYEFYQATEADLVDMLISCPCACNFDCNSMRIYSMDPPSDSSSSSLSAPPTPTPSSSYFTAPASSALPKIAWPIQFDDGDDDGNGVDDGICFDNRCRDDPLYTSPGGISCENILGLSSNKNCFNYWFESGGKVRDNELVLHEVEEEELMDLVQACSCACNVDCGDTHAPTISPAPSSSPSSSPSAAPSSTPSTSPTSSPSFTPTAAPSSSPSAAPTTSRMPTMTPTTLSPTPLPTTPIPAASSENDVLLRSGQVSGLEKPLGTGTDANGGGKQSLIVFTVVGAVVAVSLAVSAILLRKRLTIHSGKRKNIKKRSSDIDNNLSLNESDHCNGQLLAEPTTGCSHEDDEDDDLVSVLSQSVDSEDGGNKTLRSSTRDEDNLVSLGSSVESEVSDLESFATSFAGFTANSEGEFQDFESWKRKKALQSIKDRQLSAKKKIKINAQVGKFNIDVGIPQVTKPEILGDLAAAASDVSDAGRFIASRAARGITGLAKIVENESDACVESSDQEQEAPVAKRSRHSRSVRQQQEVQSVDDSGGSSFFDWFGGQKQGPPPADFDVEAGSATADDL